MPARVTVIFANALIGPAKANGEGWDPGGNRAATQKAVAAVGAALLGTNPYTATAAVLSGPVMAGVSRPDVKGKMTLYAVGGQSELNLQKRQDTFTPQWNAPWVNISLTPGIRFRVELWDGDMWPEPDDSVGSFDINYQHLVAAYRSQTTYQIPIANQTLKQVLYAGISVIPAQ